MKPTPANWSRISTALYYDEASKAIDWLCRAFGFTVRLKIESDNGSIEHSELVYGEGLIMVGQAGLAHKPSHRKSPRSLGGANTQSMMVYVDDVDAHCEIARRAGAKIISDPKTSDYGDEYWSDRSYECEDLEGHHWWFSQRLRDPK
jgi:uncharacterized glyoxalase superfamily protein PhnB